MQEKVSAQYKNEIEMAKAQRDYELKKAVYDIEVNTKKAESEMAYQLQVPHRMLPRSKCMLRFILLWKSEFRAESELTPTYPRSTGKKKTGEKLI